MTLRLSGDFIGCAKHKGVYWTECADCQEASSHIPDVVLTGCTGAPDIFVWQCIGCGHRIMTHIDFSVNDRPICVECNAEMEPVKADSELGKQIMAIWERLVPGAQM
jgi:hypothetical protein